MKPLLCLVVLVGASLGCQRGEAPEGASSGAAGAAAPSPGAGTPYARDIDRLCNSIVRSGADQVPDSERALPIANWLAANLETTESRAYMVRIQPLVGEEKARALDEEAHRVGLAECPLAAEWRK